MQFPTSVPGEQPLLSLHESLQVSSPAAALVGDPIPVSVNGGPGDLGIHLLDPSRRSSRDGSFEPLSDNLRLDASGRFVGTFASPVPRSGPVLVTNDGSSASQAPVGSTLVFGFSEPISVEPNPAAQSIPFRVRVLRPELPDLRNLLLSVHCSALANNAVFSFSEAIPTGGWQGSIVAATTAASTCDVSLIWSRVGTNESLRRRVVFRSAGRMIGLQYLEPNVPARISHLPLTTAIDLEVEPAAATSAYRTVGDAAGSKPASVSVTCWFRPSDGSTDFPFTFESGQTANSIYEGSLGNLVPGSCEAAMLLGDADESTLLAVDIATGQPVAVERRANPNRLVTVSPVGPGALFVGTDTFVGRVQILGTGSPGSSAAGLLRCNSRLIESTVTVGEITELEGPAGQQCVLGVEGRTIPINIPTRTSCARGPLERGCAVRIEVAISGTGPSTLVPSTLVPSTLVPSTTVSSTITSILVPSTVPTTVAAPTTMTSVATVPVTVTVPATVAGPSTIPSTVRSPMRIEAPGDVRIGERFVVTVRNVTPLGLVAVTAGPVTLGWARADSTGIATVENSLWSAGQVAITASEMSQSEPGQSAAIEIHVGRVPPTTRQSLVGVNMPDSVTAGQQFTVEVSDLDPSVLVAVEAAGVTLGWARPENGRAAVTNALWEPGTHVVSISEVRNNEIVSTLTKSIVVLPR